jgi:hypothetical protein
MTSHVTTHVLDAATGTPAEHVVVSLAKHLDDGAATGVAQGFTDTDGRLALGPETLDPGLYASRSAPVHGSPIAASPRSIRSSRSPSPSSRTPDTCTCPCC